MTSSIKKKFVKFNKRTRRGFQLFSKPLLSPWFEKQLNHAIERDDFADNAHELTSGIVDGLVEYKSKHNIRRVVLGVSGGIDSAVTAALFKEAGWEVIGLMMPIRQNPLETQRGREVATSLGIEHHMFDLSPMFSNVLANFKEDSIDKGVIGSNTDCAIREGNIRARLRMITLYNLAAQRRGLVASTDNFSELAAGFWTLHGDVGDLAPIQSLTKSWEIPLVAEHLNLPQSVLEATPTDGLGISAGDEAQFGFSYAQFDLVLLGLLAEDLDTSDATDEDLTIVNAVKERIRRTTFKRANPTNMLHPVSANNRYNFLAELDEELISNGEK